MTPAKGGSCLYPAADRFFAIVPAVPLRLCFVGLVICHVPAVGGPTVYGAPLEFKSDGDHAPPVTQDDSVDSREHQPAQQLDSSEAPARVAPLPTFHNLRYDEDFRYLDKYPGASRDDWRMGLKNIRLGDKWRVDFGGEFRLRVDSRSNQRFGLGARSHSAQQNYRWLMHANVRYGNLFRVFGQGIFAHVEDQDGPFQSLQENHGDVQQLFFDLRVLGEKTPLTLRVGRQELSYGAHRLVGPLEWVSARPRFDAVKLLYKGDRWNIDAFYAKPVVVNRKSADHWNEEYDFYGLYATYKSSFDQGLDVYFFGVDRTEDTTNPNGRAGDESRFTAGARIFGCTGPWDYDAELTGQWGRWAGDVIQAWAWTIDGGYTFKDWPVTPRLAAGVDWTSGDENSADGKVGTFNQLFPFNDRVRLGRQNMTRAHVDIDFWPIADRLKITPVFSVYWLNAAEDAFYSSNGVTVLRDSAGDSGVEIGQEIEIWLDWDITAHSTLSLAYAHFWDDNYTHNQTRYGDDDPELLIIQYRYRF